MLKLFLVCLLPCLQDGFAVYTIVASGANFKTDLPVLYEKGMFLCILYLSILYLSVNLSIYLFVVQHKLTSNNRTLSFTQHIVLSHMIHVFIARDDSKGLIL